MGPCRRKVRSAHAWQRVRRALLSILGMSRGARERPTAYPLLSPITAPAAAAQTTNPMSRSPRPARTPAEMTAASLGISGTTASSATSAIRSA
jgi:hypothetical protein